MRSFEYSNVIKNIAYIDIGMSILFSMLHIWGQGDPRYTIEFKIFILTMTLLFFYLGVSILLKGKVGFISLKLSIYFFYTFFPIGTYYARKILKYIKENNIEYYFRTTRGR